MDYIPELNLLLEALAYLGRRAGGNTMALLLEGLSRNGVAELEPLRQSLTPIARLMERLDRQVLIPDETLHALFGNLEGFPYNTIGSCCPAFLLFYSQISGFTGNLNDTLSALSALSPQHLAASLALCLDVAEESHPQAEMTGDEFTARILALSVPAESKVAILDLFHRPQPVLEQAAVYLRQVLAALAQEKKALAEITAPFTRELQKTGLEDFLTHTSGLSYQPEAPYRIRPFLFGLDTNLAVTQTGPVQLYCGILRGPLHSALDSSRGPEYQVYNAIKLLGDKTRFDILCYLRSRSAYGQELSSHFGLSRNTIHHHMSKLLAARLVTCTVDGNRVYYTVDRDSVALLLDRQRELLIGGDDAAQH